MGEKDLQENKHSDQQTKKWMILGAIAAVVGIAVAVIGIRQSINNMQLYIVLEAVGAALLILGVTPIAFYFINYSNYHNGETWGEQMNKKLQKRMDELEEKLDMEDDGSEEDGGFFSSLFGSHGSQANDKTAQNQNNSQAYTQPQGFVPPQGWVLADVVGITRNLRGNMNEQVEYYVICRYFDGVTRTFQTFTSAAVKDYPGKEIIGKKVRVIFHSTDPNDYTVDLRTVE